MNGNFFPDVENEIKKALQENHDLKLELSPDLMTKIIGARLRDRFGGLSVFIPKNSIDLEGSQTHERGDLVMSHRA